MQCYTSQEIYSLRQAVQTVETKRLSLLQESSIEKRMQTGNSTWRNLLQCPSATCWTRIKPWTLHMPTCFPLKLILLHLICASMYQRASYSWGVVRKSRQESFSSFCLQRWLAGRNYRIRSHYFQFPSERMSSVRVSFLYLALAKHSKQSPHSARGLLWWSRLRYSCYHSHPEITTHQKPFFSNNGKCNGSRLLEHPIPTLGIVYACTNFSIAGLFIEVDLRYNSGWSNNPPRHRQTRNFEFSLMMGYTPITPYHYTLDLDEVPKSIKSISCLLISDASLKS